MHWTLNTKLRIVAVWLTGFLWATGVHLYAQSTDTTRGQKTPPVQQVGSSTNVLLNVRLGFQFGLKTNDFFTAYRAALDVGTPDFALPFTLGAAIKADVGSWRLGVDAEYFNASIDEFYQVKVRNSKSDTTVRGIRELSEKVSLRAIPILATVEYAPVVSQFRTYIGAGLGIGMVHMTWNETVVSTISADTRIGGNLLDDAKTLPAFRLYSGVQLGYDRMRSGSNHFGSLIIEFRYTYMPYSVAAFRKLVQQIPETQLPGNTEFTIGASALSLQIGVQFNLSRLR